MDRREYILRMALFFLLAIGIIAGLQYAGKKFLPPPAPAPVRPATPEPASGQPTTATLSTATITTATAQIAAARTSPTLSRASAPRRRLTTNVFDIEFSLRGGLPVRWDVIDPRFAQPPLDDRGKPVKGAK